MFMGLRYTTPGCWTVGLPSQSFFVFFNQYHEFNFFTGNTDLTSNVKTVENSGISPLIFRKRLRVNLPEDAITFFWYPSQLVSILCSSALKNFAPKQVCTIYFRTNFTLNLPTTFAFFNHSAKSLMECITCTSQNHNHEVISMFLILKIYLFCIYLYINLKLPLKSDIVR